MSHSLIRLFGVAGFLFLLQSTAWCDTPVKPRQSSFSPKKPAVEQPPPPVQTTVPVMTVEQAEKLLADEDKLPSTLEKQPVVEAKPVIDYTIKAASVEVAWLQDVATFPLRLRAEPRPEQDLIVLSGYVPSERLREKAIQLARQSLGAIAVQNNLQVHALMAIPPEMPVDPQQARFVQDHLEKIVPGVGKSLHIIVDHSGATSVIGRVDEFADRQKIIRGLQGFPGCSCIRYELRVGTPATVVAAGVTVPVVTLNNVVVPKTETAPVKVMPEPAKLDVKFPPVPVMPEKTSDKELSLPPIIEGAVEGGSRKAKVSSLMTGSLMVQAGCIEPMNTVDTKITASSLSGLFPPGMTGRSQEPLITLGTPVHVRSSQAIVLDMDSFKSAMNANDIIQTSTVQEAATEPVPEAISVMPSLIPRAVK